MKHYLTLLLCLFSQCLLSAQVEERFADIRIVTTSNKGYEDYSPILFEDGIIYVSEDKDGGLLDKNHFYFSRIVNEEELSEPEAIELEGYSGQVGPASYCEKTKEFFFTGSVLEGSTLRLCIYVGKIEGRTVRDIKRLDLYQEGENIAHPAVSDDGTTMILSSIRDGNAGLYVYTRKKMNYRWVFERELRELNTEDMELFPCFAGDDKLVFSKGSPAEGRAPELYFSAKEGAYWSAPQPLEALNSEHDEYGIVRTGPYRGYFSSTRNGDGAHLYYFWLSEKF